MKLEEVKAALASLAEARLFYPNLEEDRYTR